MFFSCLFIQIDFIQISLKKETIEAIKIVKDSILKYESISDIPVTKQMISMVITSRQLYMDHLEKKLKEKEKKKEEATLNVEKNKSEKVLLKSKTLSFKIKELCFLCSFFSNILHTFISCFIKNNLLKYLAKELSFLCLFSKNCHHLFISLY